MSVGDVWSGLKSIILVLEKVEALATRLDDACDRMEAIADRVNELKVRQATMENEQKHVDTKLGAAAILATERLNRDLLDRVSELERRLDDVQRIPKKRQRATGLLREGKGRSALVPPKR